MNWYKRAKSKRKYKDERTEGDKIDWQLFPRQYRKNPYKPYGPNNKREMTQ